MTLLNLEIKPSVNGWKNLRNPNMNIQIPRSIDNTFRRRSTLFSSFEILDRLAETDRSVSTMKQYRQTGLSSVKMNMMKTQKHSDPRERILEVANRLFYAEGVRATGTEKIMSIAEVAEATFYRHFESKDALVLAYLESRDRAFGTISLTPPAQRICVRLSPSSIKWRTGPMSPVAHSFESHPNSRTLPIRSTAK
jgi:hypothetical protein